MWDSEGWSIGGKATLVHGGDADDAIGRMGYIGNTSMYVDGKIHPARFSKGDVIETYCVRHDDMVSLRERNCKDLHSKNLLFRIRRFSHV